MKTILHYLEKHSSTIPNKIALYENEKSITYSELWRSILCVANKLSQTGEKGDCIILIASKNIEFISYYFGAHLAGFTTIIIDPSINTKRLTYIINQTKPKKIFGTLYNKVIETEEYKYNNTNILKFYTLPEETSVADILFTTGTTGNPKGVMLSHKNELQSAININMFIGTTADSVELLALPLYHSFGLGRLRCCLLLGATVDLIDGFANIKKIFHEIENRRITGFGMVPSSWYYIREMSGDMIHDYADQLKYIEIGSAPLGVEDKKKLIELLPKTKICMHYGLTEASRSSFMCLGEFVEHLDSIGFPSPNVDIKIFNEQDIECEPYQEGEICVKGDNVCSNYWGEDSNIYRKNFINSYFKTDDWGYKDDSGRIYLLSRKKELINVGGKKVSPIEVEEILNSCPLIKESACVSFPDLILGEIVKAYVVLYNEVDINKKTELIKKFASDRLENYKVPAIIEFMRELPKTSSGKIQRLFLK